jgi:UDP:flavonoid glycosyltransferase YjiC (YdhE family)
MNCLLVCAGSAGDVHPFLGLGVALHARGHRVTVLTYSAFESLVRSSELAFEPLPGPPKGQDRIPDLRSLRHGYRSRTQYWLARLMFAVGGRWRRLARPTTVVPLLRPVYEGIARLHVPGETVVVASSQTLGARVAHDRLGVPLVHFHLSPVVFRSVRRPAVQPPLVFPNRLPRWCKDAAYRLADALVFDPLLAGPLNAFRHELGLPPVRRPLVEWRHSPQLVLAMFPDWFAPPQPDWPAHTRLVGFPLYDGSAGEELPTSVQAFLDGGTPPVVITPSSEVRKSRFFFEEAVRACRTLGRRALLITRFREQLPRNLPEGFCHADYLPFSRVLPRACAIIHHGGIGSAAQALAAGIPQLVVPLKNDQFDNADRLQRLGVARVLSLGRCRSGAIRHLLGDLPDSPHVVRRCRELAALLAGNRALTVACEAIEDLRGQRLAA